MGEARSLDLVIPVYNEGPNIRSVIDEIERCVPLSKRVLIVYDQDEDTTIPVVEELQKTNRDLLLVRNERGAGVLQAIRTGFDRSTADVVIVTMGDLSDDVARIPEMVRLIREEQFDIVCASRYVAGGRQIGGPRLKKILSRVAGVSLYHLAGIPTHDITNAFRAYRREVLQQIEIESQAGFELSMELTVKAWLDGFRITEVPATWRDRTQGQSRFRLLRWLPHYLRWYWLALRARLSGRQPARSRG